MAKASIQFKSINRLIALLRPKQAFLDLINSMPDDPNTMTMELVAHENLCFLIPEYESNEQGREFILKNSEAILEVQLEDGIKAVRLGLKNWIVVSCRNSLTSKFIQKLST